VKTTTHQLAAFGGTPMLERPIHVGQPTILNPDRLLQRFADVLRSGHLTNHGPQVREFEETVAALVQTRHCIAVCNATTALQIVARAMDLTGEVIVPAFTFIASAHALEWIGLTPIFADVDPITHTLDVASVERCVTDKTSAILGVHVWGHLCPAASLQELANHHKLRLIFDACHAFGCSSFGQPAGNFGDAEVFSFHATKFVHSFEGGVITTNNDELASRCRRLRAFGITGLTEVSDAGINGKMHELSAAAGLHSLECLPEILLANIQNREIWAAELNGIPGLSMIPIPVGNDSNCQYVVAAIDEHSFGLHRDQLVSLLRSEGLFVRSYFAPGCHRSEPYHRVPRHTPVPLPVTDLLTETVLQFPTGPGVDRLMIQRSGDLARLIRSNVDEIRHRWQAVDGAIQCHPMDPVRRPARLREAG
jgi:dTDP-4-amino-4,6-dideoxygalactose transaminase